MYKNHCGVLKRLYNEPGVYELKLHNWNPKEGGSVSDVISVQNVISENLTCYTTLSCKKNI